MLKKRIALVGATGNLGRTFIKELEARNLRTPEDLSLYASNSQEKRFITAWGQDLPVVPVSEEELQKADIIIFATHEEVSRRWIPLLKNPLIIDTSSAFRLDQTFELIHVPVNGHGVSRHQRLYATANCVASPLATVLAPLKKYWTLERVHLVTLQSCSGAGWKGIRASKEESLALLKMDSSSISSPSPFPSPMGFNLFPQIGSWLEDGSCDEERKIILELQRLLDLPLKISLTTVRVPVWVGHSLVVSLTLEENPSSQEILEVLRTSPQISLSYETPRTMENRDDIAVARFRRDNSLERTYQFWMCYDNLRRGAALDVADLLESLDKIF